MAESEKSAFCQTEVESIEHLLFSCKISSVFWKHVLSWLRDNNIIVESLKEEDIIIGKFDVGDDFLLESYFTYYFFFIIIISQVFRLKILLVDGVRS